MRWTLSKEPIEIKQMIVNEEVFVKVSEFYCLL